MTEEARLRTDIWVRAQVRRCLAEGTPAYISRRGEPNTGTVLVKINQLEAGCRVLTQIRDLDGALAWLGALGGKLVPERDADAYIARVTSRDPDVWVVEVEDRQGRSPFEGKIL